MSKQNLFNEYYEMNTDIFGQYCWLVGAELQGCVKQNHHKLNDDEKDELDNLDAPILNDIHPVYDRVYVIQNNNERTIQMNNLNKFKEAKKILTNNNGSISQSSLQRASDLINGIPDSSFSAYDGVAFKSSLLNDDLPNYNSSDDVRMDTQDDLAGMKGDLEAQKPVDWDKSFNDLRDDAELLAQNINSATETKNILGDVNDIVTSLPSAYNSQSEEKLAKALKDFANSLNNDVEQRNVKDLQAESEYINNYTGESWKQQI